MNKNIPEVYENFSDEELVKKAREDKNALSELIARYVCTAEYTAKKISHQITDDLAQEGLMGLLNAVRTYSADKNIKFSTYANVCIKNRILSSLQKNMPSGEAELTDEQLEEHIDSPEEIPENIVIEQERMNELYSKISSALTELEWHVFQMFLTGISYSQIAASLNITEKAADNAMQRVRRKLKSLLR